MTNEPFRLIFKRSQTKGSKPNFNLLVSAEMTPEFEQAAREYGLWNEIIYADPKLAEARELRARKAELKAKKKIRRNDALFDSVDGATALLLLPLMITYKLTKFVLVTPFKLAWWLFAAWRSQKKQVMRLSELKEGKTITTQSLPEIAEAEETLMETTGAIKDHVLAAMSYDTEAFEPKDVAA